MKKFFLIIILFFSGIYLQSEKITHVIQPGETLFGLSQLYNINYKDIITQNQLENTDLKINQKIIIDIPKVDEYTVKSGDSLSSIAFKNNITLKHLLLVNRINENYTLQINEKLIIPTTPEIKKVYTVKPGDTLSWISMTYNISIEELININKLENNNISPGQELSLIKQESIIKTKIASADISIPGVATAPPKSIIEYKVVKGDTLSGIALNYQTTIEDIIKENKLSTDKITIGQKLLLPDYAKKIEPLDYNIYHQIQDGDTISGLSVKYDISETLLKELNNLTDDKIYIGQKIKLIPQNMRKHTVVKGDTLWSIAVKYSVSVDQLMQYNHLNSTIVNEGETLNLYDYSVITHNSNIEDKKNTINLISYSFNHTTDKSQPNINYSIDELTNPIDKYKKASEKWIEFSSLIDKEDIISNDLKGITIVIDPGHGGKDPGAIATFNLNGKKNYIVEDEYAYDTAVRLYELLKRNGADVYMTILSPDHLARNPENSLTTFINEKNEIYNSLTLNKINSSTIWPVGGQWGLDQRVLISNKFITSSKNKKSIFISLHADNDVDRGKGKLVLFDERGSKQDIKSKKFAESIIGMLGEDASSAGMTLAVLNNNIADFKVLIELQNMAHISEAMNLIDNKKRQEDAQMITDAIKNFIRLQ